MRKRKVTDDELRKVVLARITKGDAFRFRDPGEYHAEQKRQRGLLAGMTRAEIFARYPYAVYDIVP